MPIFIKAVYRRAIVNFAVLYLFLGALLYFFREFLHWLELRGFNWGDWVEKIKTFIGL